MELYPAMDLLEGRVVRLHRGRYEDATTYAVEPLAVLESFAAAGALRAHLVDLDGARAGEATQQPLLRALLHRAKELGLAVQVGGGIRTRAQAERYLDAGAERVVLGTAAVRDPELVRSLCESVPVVVAVDARDGRVAVQGWTERTEVLALELARRVQQWGARAVLYTDIARDGTGEGPAVDSTAELARACPGLEVIASGGVGSLGDLLALAARPEIAAAVAGRALYEGRFTALEGVRALREGRARA